MQITKALSESRLVDSICAIIGMCILFSVAFLAILVTAFLGSGVWFLAEELYYFFAR